MATQFKLAAMGHTMETGRVVEWHISEGESIDEGQLLISIETDKTVVDVNSPVSGVLLKTVGQVDTEYDVGEVLAWIGDAGETVPDQPGEPDPKKQSVSAGPRVTPVAQRLADRHGINADAVDGTGPDGRVTKEDVQRAIDDGTAATKAEDTSVPAGEVVPLSGIRRITAERLSANWGVAPHVSEGIEVDFSRFESYRIEHEADWQEKWGAALGPNHLILAATAQVLKDHPDLNAGFIDGAICRYNEVNLGVAIDIDAGLVVPVVRNADKLSIGEIARTVRELAVKARENRLTPDEMEGATFSVSNLGGLGIDWFTPVLNPPQCGILGIGRIQRVPRYSSNEIVARDLGTLVLTFDHRLIDGAPCARFLSQLRGVLEAPEALLGLSSGVIKATDREWGRCRPSLLPLP